MAELLKGAHAWTEKDVATKAGLDSALRADPSDKSSLVALAMLFIEKGQLEQAEEMLKRAMIGDVRAREDAPQVLRRARERAARADGARERVHPTLSLAPYFRSCRPDVGVSIRSIVELVRPDASERLRQSFADLLVVVLRFVGRRRHLDDPRS